MMRLPSILILAVTLFVLSSCHKTDDNKPQDTTTEISNSLHFSFKTPDWERFIDCSQLDLSPVYLNDSTFYVSATSASTQESFFFSYPADSSVMVRPNNLTKYPIQLFGGNEGFFEFSQKLPITEGSMTKLVSETGFSATVYNEVVEIKYVNSETEYAVFQIKCRYAMLASVLPEATTKRNVSGTFHFKVRTYRK